MSTMLNIYTKADLDLELKKNKKVFALFYATWCPYCRGFVPVFDEKAVNLGFDRILHVLLDDYDNPLWDDYDVAAVPTVIVFEEGKVSSRLDGRLGRGLSVSQFLGWLDVLEKSR
jgi:thioredoxin